LLPRRAPRAAFAARADQPSALRAKTGRIRSKILVGSLDRPGDLPPPAAVYPKARLAWFCDAPGGCGQAHSPLFKRLENQDKCIASAYIA